MFTSSAEVLTYYTTLIDQLIPKLHGITEDGYQTVQSEIADLRQELVNELKNFGHSKVDVYFNEAMATAESDKELNHLSNAYEEILLAKLVRLKEKLQNLRTT
jgi:protein subunit release factor A